VKAIEPLLAYGFGRPIAVDYLRSSERPPGVVRVPYQARSAEEWQKEADAFVSFALIRRRAKIQRRESGAPRAHTAEHCSP
jgi:hypothetical protein